MKRQLLLWSFLYNKSGLCLLICLGVWNLVGSPWVVTRGSGKIEEVQAIPPSVHLWAWQDTDLCPDASSEVLVSWGSFHIRAGYCGSVSWEMRLLWLLLGPAVKTCLELWIKLQCWFHIKSSNPVPWKGPVMDPCQMVFWKYRQHAVISSLINKLGRQTHLGWDIP